MRHEDSLEARSWAAISGPGWRATAWLLAGLCAAGGAWIWMGRVDVVAGAHGLVVPAGQVKTVQAVEHSVLQRVHVRNGQQVAAGELLIEFDGVAIATELARLEEEMLRLRLDRARFIALLEGGPMGEGESRSLVALEAGIAPALLRLGRQQLAEQRAEAAAVMAEIDSTVAETRASLRAAALEVRELEAVLPLVAETARAHRTLAARGTVARVEWLAQEREHRTLAGRLDVAKARAAALAETLRTAQARKAATRSRLKQGWLTELSEVERKLMEVEEDRARTRERLSRLQVTAPVAGTVQQLALHTVGAVATPAQALLVIVPQDAPLEVEARIENRDIGFVAPGQRAVVKLETWDFTRYGFLVGEVLDVSRAAIPEREGETGRYSARIGLPRASNSNLGQRLPLRAGMRARVEIALGRRRVLEFLLSPLQRYRQESIRER